MAKSAPRRFSRLRRIFRWCRILVWLAILLAVIAGIYLNSIGLPDFLKHPLLAKLRAEGVQMDFSRMRLRWYRGIVVDEATFTFLKHPLQPKFYSAETELNLDIRSLRASLLKLNSIAIEQGNLVWQFSATNHSSLGLSNITGRIQFRSGDKIDFDKLRADCANTQIKISGSVTNVSAIRDWKLFQQKPTRKGQGLEQFADVLNKIHLSGSPELTLDLTGDAADPRSFKGKLNVVAAAADTPWGKGNNLQVAAELAGLSNAAENNSVRLKADSAETVWGNASNLNCVAKLSFPSTNIDTFQTDLKISARQLRLKSGRAASMRVVAQTRLSLTNLIPSGVSGKASFIDAETKWGKAGSADITFSAATNSAPKLADESWAAWKRAEPFFLTWEALATKVETPKLKMEKVSCAGTWRAPELQISNLEAELYEGGLSASGQLNVATREANVKGSSDFEVQKLSPLLTPFGRRWIGKYSWEMPPALECNLRAILPAWTNRSPDWHSEVLPTLELNGHVSVGRGTYRDVTANSAKTDFTYSNMVWTLPHLRVERTEGGADMNLVANDRTGEFYWRVHSQIDPKAIRHLLTEKQQRVFDDFQFTTPPEIHVALRGHWGETEKISADGELAASHFSYRSNTVDKFTGSLQLTNQNLQVSKMRLEQAGKFITAQRVALDFSTMEVSFTDVYSTVDPYPIIRLLGEDVVENLAPYQFADLPAIRLNGSLTVTNIRDADLHFLVEGTQFRWKEFSADRIAGRLDWIGETLLVTNVQAGAYRGGTIAGWAYFDFAVTNGTAFRFDFAGSDIDFSSAIRGLSGKTNQLEGLLHGQWAIDYGNTRDFKTWYGRGRANLRDGLIWEVPIFGIFSPALNALMPGAGNSRAREASASFMVKDGIFYSDDLEIRALGLRMQYRGGVDFQQNVDARVEAELLRDAWVVGPLISLVLTPIAKVFEYKVTGTLSKPASEPVYIPNFLMMTLRPFHSLKEALAPEKPETEPAPIPATETKP